MTLTYDAQSDVLYLTFKDQRRGTEFHHIESESGDVYRIDEEREVIVGCTILNFMKRAKRDDIQLPEIGPVSYDPRQIPLFQPEEALE